MRVLLYTLVLTLMLSCAGAKLSKDDMVYTQIINVDGVKKDDLYISVNQWFVEKFRNAESVIEFSDKDAGNISGKYVEIIKTNRDFYKSTIFVDIKDNKIRVTAKNPVYGFYIANDINRMSIHEKPIDRAKQYRKIKKTWLDLFSNLEEYLQKRKKSKDW